MHHSETIQHLPKISGGTVDICNRIEAIGHAELSGGGRHQLPETNCSDTADGQRIVSGLRPNERVEQARGQGVLCLGCIDMGQIARSTKARGSGSSGMLIAAREVVARCSADIEIGGRSLIMSAP